MDLNQVSKYLSLVLRHKPEVVGITLDEHGWADVYDLITGVRKKYPRFCYRMLEQIVEFDEKKRYSFDEHCLKIRANQGHSVNVDVELEEIEPPEFLYHGTGEKYVESIIERGLIPKSRLYVHLSIDEETAENVGRRHGKPVIFIISSKRMYEDCYKFYKSKNGVWLTKEVPVEYFVGYVKRPLIKED